MRRFLGAWKACQSRSQSCEVLLFLDYDGTLTPIVRHPSEARLAPDTRNILRKLARYSSYRMGIISGRRLREVKQRVGVPGICYVGNHGLEIETPKRVFIHPKAKVLKKIMTEIRKKLNRGLAEIPNVWVEDKIYTLSVHYRQALPKHVKQAEEALKDVTHSYQQRKKIKIRKGKKVWEIRPYFSWNKGDAVAWLIKFFKKQRPFDLLVYIGDDKTDEDAFSRVCKKGFAVKVTKHPKQSSKADFWLNSTGEVKTWLNRLAKHQ